MTSFANTAMVKTLEPPGISNMARVTFKICSRCQFRFPAKKSSCTTCGNTHFSEQIVLELPGKDIPDDPPPGAQRIAGGGNQGTYGGSYSATQNAGNIRSPYYQQLQQHPEWISSAYGKQSQQSFRPNKSSSPPGPEVEERYSARPLNNALRQKFCAPQEEVRTQWLDEKFSWLKNLLGG